MDKIIKKLFCWVLGHNYHPKIKDMYCVRCGTSRPKTAEEMGYTEPKINRQLDRIQRGE